MPKSGRPRIRIKTEPLDEALKPKSVDQAQNQAIKKIQRKLKKFPDPERKYTSGTASYTGDQASFDGAIVDITDNISQGTADSNQRIGDKIHAKYLDIRGHVTPNSSTVRAVFCFMVVKVKDGSTLSALSSIWDSTGSSSAVAGMQKWDTFNQYKVLYYKRIPILATYEGAKLFSKRIKLNFPIEYSAAGTTTDRNSLFLVAWSDQASTGSFAPGAIVGYRMVFDD